MNLPYSLEEDVHYEERGFDGLDNRDPEIGPWLSARKSDGKGSRLWGNPRFGFTLTNDVVL